MHKVVLQVAPLAFLVMGLYYLRIALKGLIQKRPFTIKSGTWIPIVAPLILLVCVFPLGFRSGMSMSNLIMQSLPIVFTFGILIFIRPSSTSFTVFGMDGGPFREVLVNILKKKGISFEENVTGIKLTSMATTLKVIFSERLGLGYIKTEPNKKPFTLELEKDFSNHLKASSIPVRLSSFYRYLVIGLFFLCVAGAFFYAFNRIRG
jgi:hypothetical protein